MPSFTFTPTWPEPEPTSVIIEPGALEGLPRIVASLGEQYVPTILYDVGIAPVAERIARALETASLMSVESGDASKSLSSVERIVAEMLAAGCGRQTVLIVVGGGMLTDLGGFIASTFMRGIPFILVPTTSLAMIDAAIGGKTAVNVRGRKNMLGTIAEPRAIVADIDLLLSLPEKQYREGLVEAVKIAAIADAELFEWMEAHLDGVLHRNPNLVTEFVSRSVALKLEITKEDLMDEDVRLLLNFGHTIGHAVEALMQYTISHGDAVSIGMALEMELAAFPDRDRILVLLHKLGTPTMLPSSGLISAEALWRIMLTDKKNVDGEVRMSVPDGIGTGMVEVIDPDRFKILLQQ